MESVSIIFLIFLALIDFIIKKYRSRKLFKLIQWVVTQRAISNYSFDSSTLVGRIYNFNSELEPMYRLEKVEKERIGEILNLYQDYLKDGYFDQKFTLNKKSSKLSEEEYFMYMFLCYLDLHESDKIFNNQEMYVEKSRTTYGSWGYSSYDATFTITDYGLLYNKLLYLVCTVCEKNKRISNVIQTKNSFFIKKRIDSREISMSRFN